MSVPRCPFYYVSPLRPAINALHLLLPIGLRQTKAPVIDEVRRLVDGKKTPQGQAEAQNEALWFPWRQIISINLFF